MRNYIMYINVSRETWRSCDLLVIINILISIYYSYYIYIYIYTRVILLFYYYLYLYLSNYFLFIDIFFRILAVVLSRHVSLLASPFIFAIIITRSLICRSFILSFSEIVITLLPPIRFFARCCSRFVFSSGSYTWEKFQGWLHKVDTVIRWLFPSLNYVSTSFTQPKNEKHLKQCSTLYKRVLEINQLINLINSRNRFRLTRMAGMAATARSPRVYKFFIYFFCIFRFSLLSSLFESHSYPVYIFVYLCLCIHAYVYVSIYVLSMRACICIHSNISTFYSSKTRNTSLPFYRIVSDVFLLFLQFTCPVSSPGPH